MGLTLAAILAIHYKGQFEKNGILTSKAIQRKYAKITDKRKRVLIESRFCVLDEELMPTLTRLMSEEIPHSKGEKRKEKGERKETPPPGDVQHHFSAFLAAWDTLANDENALSYFATTITSCRLKINCFIRTSEKPHEQMRSKSIGNLSASSQRTNFNVKRSP